VKTLILLWKRKILHLYFKGDLKANEVWLSPTTKKLLIQLEDDSRNSIEALKIDKDAMVAIDTGSAVRGVIVTSKVRPLGIVY
jgi:hypothetical protein